MLPIPPSINHHYATVNGRRVLSAAGRRFKALVGQEVLCALSKHAGGRGLLAGQSNAPLALNLRFYFVSELRRDIDGGLKITQDAVCEALGINDNRIVEVTLRKDRDAAAPRMELALRTARILFAALCCLIAAAPFAQAGAAPDTRDTPSGDRIELEYTAADGVTARTILPIYRVGAVQYFSAGMGVEERAAQYPPYPLKLVFLAGPRAYIAQVAVTIKDTKGAVNLLVPGEQVTGPWLFVDLPAGTYEITAIRRDRSEIKQKVSVGAGGSRTVYFRWKE